MASTVLKKERNIEDLVLNVNQEMHVRATLEETFAALLEQLGPENETAEGKPMPMKIEPWPGGRWYRDLGGENGHFWGHVQAIKRSTLLEFTGPLFMSYPVVSNVQYRLIEVDGGTLIRFHHTALGLILEDHGLDILVGTYNWLDLAPKGRDEDGLAHKMAWVRHHDKYGEGYVVDPKAGYVQSAKTEHACCEDEQRA